MGLCKKTNMMLAMVLVVLALMFYHQGVAQTNISGNVSGTWSAGNAYYVVGDLTVPKEATLTIEPGVVITFADCFTFTVDGLLQAKGTADQPVVLRGGGIVGLWKKLLFSENAKAGCVLKHCVVRDGGWDDLGNIYIVNNNNHVTIEKCDIYNGASHGIVVEASLVTNGGDNLTRQCQPLIMNNAIHHNAGSGVLVKATYQNTGNNADNNSCLATPAIKNNLIYKNQINGIRCSVLANGSNSSPYYDDQVTVQANPTIQQNTIFGCGRDGITGDFTSEDRFGSGLREANPLISTNIIASHSEHGIVAKDQPFSPQNIKYNCFWNQPVHLGNIGGALGEICCVNLNGDSCDVNMNIFFDPALIAPETNQFNLQSSSKCIDAGDTSLPLDTDGSRPDIGALPYAAAVQCQRGDINMDGLITPEDALCAFLIYMNGGVPPAGDCNTECAVAAADANCDGSVSSADAMVIFQAYRDGLKPPLDCPTSTSLKVSPKKCVVSVHPQQLNVLPGETVDITIEIAESHQMSAFGLDLGYPAEILSFVKASATGLTENWQNWAAQENVNGVVTIGGFQQQPVQSDDATQLVTMTFQVKENASEAGELWLFNLKDDLAAATTQSAAIHLKNKLAPAADTKNTPDDYALAQNHPNPFNPATRIHYQLPEATFVELVIFNTLGQKIRTLVSSQQTAGFHQIEWDGRNEAGLAVPSGLYFYRFQTDKFLEMKKMLLMR